MRKETKIRSISGTVLISVLAISLLRGGDLWALFCSFVAVAGCHELLKVAGVSRINKIAMSVMMALFVVTNIPELAMFLVFYFVFYSVLNRDDNKKLQALACGILSLLVMVSIGRIYLMREMGIVPVALLFALVWAADTGAYVFGKLFGRCKLAPKISPNKTVEGAIGGVIVAVIVSYLLSGFITDEKWLLMAASIFLAVLSIFGDLFFSKIKRELGIKDFGSLIPGHGGFLDRFDGIIVVAPVLYFVLLLLQQARL